ncbi:MAG: tetratricopeptide repeat protein, partial [Pseudomonadota bacterium]
AAANLAEDPLLRGNAHYRNGDFEAAAQAFERASGPDGAYNLGNALAQQQRYEEALAAYDRALADVPDMEDAIYNRELVEKLLEEQQQQQEQEQESESDEQQQDQQQQDGEQQDSEGESQEQQQAEGEQEPTEEEGEPQAEPIEEDLSEEERQALEQWLRRIPDDPGGLLRRKFLLEYQRRGSPQPREDEDW